MSSNADSLSYSESSTYNQLVPKLPSVNYATWKPEMEMLLTCAGFWSIVSQCMLCTTPTTTSGSASSTHTCCNTAGPSSDANYSAVQRWHKAAKRATAVILLYLGKHIKRRVLNIQNPVQIWVKLQTFSERKGFSAHFYRWQNLITLQLADYQKHEGNVMELYLDAFHSHVQPLCSSGALVSNEIEASSLLKGLDDGYDSSIVSTTQSIGQTADAKLDVEQLVSQLCNGDCWCISGHTATEISDPNTG